MSSCYNPFSLEGKTILITGASSGIGKATAIECTRLGASMVITGRNKEKLEATLVSLEGDGHKMICADLTDTEELEALIAELPALDGAVLSAGVSLTMPVKFSNSEKFKEIFETNLFSQTELARLLFKKKKLKDNGSLVFISSIGGTKSFNPGNAIYGASKAALNSFMKYCALEFASRKIRVNSICPGMVRTPLISRGTISEEQLEEYAKKYLLKRFGTPQEVAWGAIYLLSDASSWTTGSCLNIDGGGDSNN